jgi:predicted DNA-binding protein (UPF0251 family)
VSCEIHAGFLTDIDELRRDARRDRMAVRKEALNELIEAARLVVDAALRHTLANSARYRLRRVVSAS